MPKLAPSVLGLVCVAALTAGCGATTAARPKALNFRSAVTITASSTTRHCNSTADPRPAWRKIVRWTKTHAPKVHRLLKPRATHRQIKQLRHGLHVVVPQDLVVWLKQNNGANFRLDSLFPYDNHQDSANQILSDYRTALSVNTRHYRAWSKTWIPLLTDIGGDEEFVHAGPGKKNGCVYAYDFEDGPPGDFEYPSIAAMLHSLLRSIHRGRTPDNWKLVLRHGGMDWVPQQG
jgi:cell wall assembly regulator SMI1